MDEDDGSFVDHGNQRGKRKSETPTSGSWTKVWKRAARANRSDSRAFESTARGDESARGIIRLIAGQSAKLDAGYFRSSRRDERIGDSRR